MKKLKVLGVAAAAIGMFSLTSCLGKGENTQTIYGLGRVEFSMDAFGNVVTDDYGSVAYSPSFAGLNVGDFVMYYGTLNYDTQPSNRYMTVDVEQNGFARLSRWYSDSQLTDKEVVLPNESTITQASFAIIYAAVSTELAGNFIHSADQHVFISTAYKDIPNDREFSYQLSYDGNMTTTNSDGRKVYDLYLRAIVTEEGDNVENNYSYTEVFDLTQFLSRATQIARSEGDDRIYLRLNYPSAFNADSTSITWTQTDPAAYPVLAEQ